MEDDSTDEVEEEKDAKRKLSEEDDISEEVEMRKEEEENEEEEEKQVNKMLIEEGGISCEDEENEEGEEREVKRRRIEEVDSSNGAKSMILSSCKLLSSNELAASSISTNGTVADVNNSGSSSGSRPVPGRMETGNFSKVPPELFRHILKFLSSEVFVLCICGMLYLDLLLVMELNCFWAIDCRILLHALWSVDSFILLLLMSLCGVACEYFLSVCVLCLLVGFAKLLQILLI